MVPASLVESRSARIALALTATLAVSWLLLRGEQPRVLVDQHERARVRVMTAARTAAIAAERCPRPALRTPALAIDGSPLLAGLVDQTSPEIGCLQRVSTPRHEVERCDSNGCKEVALSAVPSRPDIIAACAPLYEKIDQLAYTTEACSPWSAPGIDPITNGADVWYGSFAFAIKLRVAPLYTAGELSVAARHIIDAMRFADDHGRKGYMVNAAISIFVVTRLADSLADILTDPRLTSDEARAIARDLDVLLASGPTIDAMMRQESRFGVAQADEQAKAWPYTGDADQDAVLSLIAIERALRHSEAACRDKSLRACLEARRAPEPAASADFRERLPAALLSGESDHALRERIIQDMVSPWQFYPANQSDRPFALAALRMQAELRMMPIAECRDPDVRRKRLAPWFEHAVLASGPEPIVVTPALFQPPWVKAKRRLSRTLRCVGN